MSNDVQFLVECLSTELVSMLMDTYGWDKKLSDPECGLYYQGAVYVFSFLKNEIENGIIK